MHDFVAFITSDYSIHLCILIGIYLILAESFNLTFGLGGFLNLAHVSLYAIGAYTTALLSTEVGYGFWVCIATSMVFSGFLALVIGAISLKLSEEYFAVGTLAFSAVISALLINWKSVTRGVLGIPGIPRPSPFGEELIENRDFLTLTVIVTAVLLVWFALVFRSRLARELKAQAEHPLATQALGVNTRSVRNDAFIISSIGAGAAGSLFAYYINYIDPSSFGLSEMVFLLSIVIVGQPGSFIGVFFSTVFLVLLPEPLRFIEIPPSVLGPMRQLLYALILFGVVYWKRATLFPRRRTI